MSLILVVEPESRYIERINDALGADGWKIQSVPGHDEALAAVASQSPDLIVVSAQAPGADRVVSAFSRRAGGPGVLVLLAEGEEANGRFGGEDRLGKPFTAQELRLAVKRAASARREAPSSPVSAAAANQPKLTSRQIFGDVLAEVEDEMSSATLRTLRPAAAAPAPRGTAGGRDADEIQRKLDETLSGMLKPAAKGAAAAAAAKPGARPEDEVDDLISKTLTGLHLEKELEKSKAGVAAKPAPAPTPVAVAPQPAVEAPPVAPPVVSPPAVAAPPPVVEAPPVVPASATPPPAPAPPRRERTGSGKITGEIALAELEEMTRSRRPKGAPAPATARPAPVAVAPVPAAAAVVEEPQQPGEKFGQYTLLERIAVGGMAELYKARMRGVEGFQKTVAIKRILPHLTDNAEFVEMFIDEGKLAAQLTHPNIAHIYDLGKIGHDFYIAMEYVEGKDLRSTLNLARKKGMPMPLGLALLIGARLASALDYAHRKRDFEGREMGLVHRDVSPQNILLTSEGDIKLVDFGIAKAVSKASQTQIGALKGKLQYMSPEQAWGRQVDGRSDIFSLGAVLFELLTGERLFAGDSEVSVLAAVREGKVRSPRQVNPAVTAEVDAIVMRALKLEPEERYATAGELQQRLEAALYALRPTPGHSDLAAYLERLLESEPPAAAAAVAAPRESSAPTAVKAAAAAAARAGAEVPAMAPALPAGAGPLVEEGRRGRGLLIAAMLAVAVIGVVLFLLFGRTRGPAQPEPSAAQAETARTPARRGPVPARPGAQAPAGAAAAAVPGAPNVDQLVNEGVAKREEELRRRAEEEKKRLEREVEAAKLAAAKLAEQEAARKEAAAEAAQPAPVVPVPEPVREEPAPEPARQEPEPVREEPAPAAAEPAPEAPRTREGDLVRPGPGVTPPQLVSYDKPQYPAAAKRLGVQGDVVVAVLVDEEGRVQEARIAAGVNQAGGLNEAALAAARTARYRPATKDGVRVKMWSRLRIPFKH